MSKNTFDPELIESNWSTFESLCGRFGDPGLTRLLDETPWRSAATPPVEWQRLLELLEL